MLYVPTGSPFKCSKTSSYGRVSHHGANSFLHTLHQDWPHFGPDQLAQFCVLIPYSLYLNPSLLYFAFCSIWLFLPLIVSLRLFCTFLLWLGCQASPHQPSHLGSGQTTHQLLMQATIVTAMTTPLMQNFNVDWRWWYHYHNCVCWTVPCIYLTWFLCLHHRPTVGIAQWEIAHLFKFSIHAL